MTGRAEHTRAALPWLRPGVQIVCLGLFVCLAFAARSQWKSPLPYDLFLRFDPVVWLMASLAAREAALYGSFALVLIAATGMLVYLWKSEKPTLLQEV